MRNRISSLLIFASLVLGSSLPLVGETVVTLSFSSARGYSSAVTLGGEAEIVIRGRVVGALASRPLEVQVDGPYARELLDVSPILVTERVLEVMEVLKGQGVVQEGELVVVEQLGGESGNLRQVAPAVVSLQKGAEAVLFLRRYVGPDGKPGNRWVILGENQGQYNLEGERFVNPHLLPDPSAEGTRELGEAGHSSLPLSELRRLVQGEGSP